MATDVAAAAVSVVPIFTALSLPKLMILIIVMMADHLLRKHLLDNEGLLRRRKAQAVEVTGRGRESAGGMLDRPRVLSGQRV